MPPPPPWPLAWARRLTALLFRPILFGASGALGLILAFALAAVPAAIIAVAIVFAAGAAGLFAATRHYRWRTPPLDAARMAVTAALLLGTATSLPLGMAAFSPVDLYDGRAIATFAIAVLGQFIAVRAFRWSVTASNSDLEQTSWAGSELEIRGHRTADDDPSGAKPSLER